MSSSQWGQVAVTSSGAALLVQPGGGTVLLSNLSATNTVWLGDDPMELAGSTSGGSSPLLPNGFASFDGSAPVYGICDAGQSALVAKYPGGGNFFQLVELIVKTLLISGPVSNGVFVYSGAAGVGDLVESISALASQDPFHNTVFPGFTSYTGNGALDLFMTLSNAGLAWGTNQNGPGGTGALAQSGPITLRVQDLIVATDPVAGPPTAETWHALPLAAGWTQAGGQAPAAYRLLPDNTVEIVGSVTHASFTTNIALTSTALPAAYRPVNNYGIAGDFAGDAGIQVNNAGGINAELGTLAAATVCRFNGRYPLDN